MLAISALVTVPVFETGAGDKIGGPADRGSHDAHRARREFLRIHRAAGRGSADRQNRNQATAHRMFIRHGL